MANLPPPFKPQDQRAVSDQLRDLVLHATRLGMYDAADIIQLQLLTPSTRYTTAQLIHAVAADSVTLSDEVQAILAEATPPSGDTRRG